MRYAIIALVLSTLTLARLSQAQTLPPEARDAVNQVISQAVNAITLFTSQNTVSSGSFTIENGDGEPDSELDVYRIPFEYPLVREGTVIPYIDGNLGFVRIVESFPPVDGPGENDFSRINTRSAALGLGVKLLPREGLSIAPAVSASYSHTRNFFDYNNPFSQEVLAPFGKQLYRWQVETMTYVPSLRVGYDFTYRRPTFSLWSKYSHLFNDSISTDSPTIAINSDTGLWQNSIAAKVPLQEPLAGLPVAVRTTFTRTDVYRSGRRGLAVGYFHELGLELVADLKDSMQVLKQLSLGANYSFGEDFHGWRLGVGYEF